MPYDPTRHHRRSIRLKNYDYTQPGAYFVTIVTQYHECLFGRIVNGQMMLNDAGRMIQIVWNTIPQHYPGVETDAFVVMPNHIHGIIVITDVKASAFGRDNRKWGNHRRGRPCACPYGQDNRKWGNHRRGRPCACPYGQGNRKWGNHKGCPYGGRHYWGV